MTVIDGGNMEPQAVARPAVTDQLPRCFDCGRILNTYATQPWEERCQRCKAITRAGQVEGKPEYRFT